MAIELPLRENDDIQGDILAGFKKDQMVLLFLRFEDPVRARTWLQQLTPRIATTRQVAAFNKAFSEARKSSGGDPTAHRATWMSVSFTYPGMSTLIGREPCPRADPGTSLGAFQQGAAARAGNINDTGDSAPEGWLFGNNKSEDNLHAVLTIASDSPADLVDMVREQREAAARFRISVVFQQDCATLPGERRGKEHFGFKDGVSEPGVWGFDEEDPLQPGHVKGEPGTRLIPPGEFVIGQPSKLEHETPRPEPIPAWMIDGSFQVVRRLAQDVPGFWSQVARQLAVLKEQKAVPNEASVEWLAARLVGRWRSGCPVAKCPDADRPFDTVLTNDNNISYLNDLQGHVTPLFSHLRKTNPRDALEDPRPGGEIVQENPFIDRRRIIRRGSPYGNPFDPAAGGRSGPDESRGLLFVCYQADLIDQFEFIQKSWIDNPDFPRGRDPQTGVDAMVGVKGDVNWERPDGSTITLGFQRFVRTEGAVYAFVPSITVLRELAEGRLPDKPGPQIGQPLDTFLPVPDRQRADGRSEYWVFRTVGGEQTYRYVSIADGDGHQDALQRGDRRLSQWQSFQGVEHVDAVLPFPDGQRVRGKSYYWLFHTPLDGRQRYRVISIADGPQHADALERPDGGLERWASLGGVTGIDCVLPVPDRQRAGGRSWYWIFHTVNGEQLYRMISIADGDGHQDTLEMTDRRISSCNAFAGVTRILEILPFPDAQRVNGTSWYWVFHGDQYRIITIDDGDSHVDRIQVPDRPVNLWNSLTADA